MKQTPLLFGIATILSLYSCSKSKDQKLEPEINPPAQEVPSTHYDLSQLSLSTVFDFNPQVTRISRQEENELSGIAASQQNPGLLYMHNDYKNATILITNAQGQDLGKIILEGVSSLDPEDICVGPGPESGKTYIYLGDIGDNKSTRSTIAIYRIEEPTISSPNAETRMVINQATKLELKYPKGANNAESLMIDPLNKDLFLATKEVNRSSLYKIKNLKSPEGIQEMENVLNMPAFDLLTAGDISPDGKEILLRNKGQIWYWKRTEEQSLVDCLLTAPQKAPYAGNENQGEGIGFSFNGNGYYTNSETRDKPGAISNLSFYSRK